MPSWQARTCNLSRSPLEGLRVGIAQGLPLRTLDVTVTAKLFDAFNALNGAGVQLTPELLPVLDDMARANPNASGNLILLSEVYAVHRDLMAARGAEYDPFVRARIERGRNISAADYIAVTRQRAAMVRAMDEQLANLDALVMPTSAIVAPTISECQDPEMAFAREQLIIRNPRIVNFFDLCAISLPLPRSDGLPVGLMLVARNGQDRRLLRIAAAVERLFA